MYVMQEVLHVVVTVTYVTVLAKWVIRQKYPMPFLVPFDSTKFCVYYHILSYLCGKALRRSGRRYSDIRKIQNSRTGATKYSVYAVRLRWAIIVFFFRKTKRAYTKQRKKQNRAYIKQNKKTTETKPNKHTRTTHIKKSSIKQHHQ